MARRNVLQEIPISVPQTEQQSYEIVSEEEGSIPYTKQIPSEQRPHSRFISNDESKENITPTLFEDIFSKMKSQVSGNVDLLGDPGPSSSHPTSDSSTGAGDLSTPRRSTEGSPDDLQGCNTPMDFSSVTVGDLGICSESFTTKCAGKSPKSLHKHRRRSTIGVRGSPEMNFLIRQIALQRSSRKSEPEPLDNPFTSPRNSILREKISAFRNAFQAVEETEGKLSFPGFLEVKESVSGEGKVEVASEPPEKRKKVCDATGPEIFSIRPDPPVALCPPQPLESSQSVFQKPVPEKTLESDVSRLSTDVPSKPVELQSDEAPTVPSSSRCRKRRVMFASLLSPPEPTQSPPLDFEVFSGPVLKPALKKTPRRDFVHFRVGFIEETGADLSSQDSSDNGENADIYNKPEDSLKRKRVTFGRELSPELFDRTLPADTPLRRGSTPYNRHNIAATPYAQQLTCQSPCDPLPQPDFDDRDQEETLQPLSLCFDAESSDSDSPASSSLPDHHDESSPNEEEAAVNRSASTDHEPVTSSKEMAEETDTSVSLSDADIVNESFIAPPEVSTTRIRKLRSSEKPPSSGETLESNDLKTPVIAKVRSTAKKTRKPMIIRKAQMKAPRGKGKKKGGKSKKSVQKPVNNERDGISKRPLLSPIPELPECVPTPPAPTSGVFPPGKSSYKYLVKKVRTQASAGKVHFTFADSVEGNLEEKGTERPPLCVEDVPAPEDMKGSNNGSQSEDLPGSDAVDLAPQAEPVSSECPPSLADMEGRDQVCKTATSPVPSSEVAKKTKNTKRRSSTRKYAARAPESTHCVTSKVTVDCVRLDEDADHVSYKPNDPVQGAVAPSSMSNGLSDKSSTTSPSKPPLGCISTDHKKSRRSSRIHQVSSMLSANPEQNAPVPYLAEHSDSSMSDFCLPIDEALQYPQQEKKVRRSMRLRRDSGVIGLSWVEEIKGSDPTGRRRSLSSVMRLEESSEESLDHTVHSPNKENLSSLHVPNLARRTRRRTLGTTTTQEGLLTCDTKRRRSISSHKAPNTTATSDEVLHSALVPDA